MDILVNNDENDINNNSNIESIDLNHEKDNK